MRRTIYQIMPADEWNSVALSYQPPYYSVTALAGWALVDKNDDEGDDNDRQVVGLIAFESCELVDESDDDEYQHFVYARNDEITEKSKAIWEEAGRKRFEKWKAERLVQFGSV